MGPPVPASLVIQKGDYSLDHVSYWGGTHQSLALSSVSKMCWIFFNFFLYQFCSLFIKYIIFKSYSETWIFNRKDTQTPQSNLLSLTSEPQNI